MTRRAFAHDVLLAMGPEQDDRAPGGAITVALCGSWAHEPPCPLAPHHTAVQRSGAEVRLRLLFAAESEDEERVRALVAEALGRGAAERPNGTRAVWRLLRSAPSPVRPDEGEHAGRLVRS